MLAQREPARRRAAGLLVVLPFAAGYYVSYLLRTVNAVIAPELTRALGLGAGELGLLTSTYFLAFAVAQLPVGVALDKLGPRKVVSALLLLGTAGTLAFATGESFLTLALGRGMVGLGVSACLMGALKAFAAAFPAERQASLTGVIMSSGAVGALTASLPLAWALPRIGWRGSLLVVAGASAAAALLVATLVPRDLLGGARPGADAQAGGRLRELWRVPGFARFAWQAALFTGGFMALQGLWAGPWLMTVEGRSRAAAAATLLFLNLGMLTGQIAIGVGATRLLRAGWGRERLMTTGLGLALGAFASIVLGLWRGPAPWFAFGFFAAAGAQVYGVAASRFPPALSGRVSTAVNLFAFVGAFLIQWGIGASVEVLQPLTSPVAAFRITFGALWALQVGAVAATALGPRAPQVGASPWRE